MKNNKLDKFYTNPKVVNEVLGYLFDSFNSIKDNPNAYNFIEPSAGTGNFIDGLYNRDINIKKNVFAFDIEPKNNDFIIKSDFLNIDIKKYIKNKKKTITIGNPPFGKRGDTAIKFLNKSLEHSSIVAFILPNTFRRFLTQKKIKSSSKLIFDKRLPNDSFLVGDREYNVSCCFQIWVNNDIPVYISDMRLKKQINSLEDEVKVFIHNNTKDTLKYFDKKKYKWDFAIHRQGYYNYNKRITDPKNLSTNKQYLFVRCKNKTIMEFIKKIDFQELASKNNTTVLGFSNSDFYEKLYYLIIINNIENSNFF